MIIRKYWDCNTSLILLTIKVVHTAWRTFKNAFDHVNVMWGGMLWIFFKLNPVLITWYLLYILYWLYMYSLTWHEDFPTITYVGLTLCNGGMYPSRLHLLKYCTWVQFWGTCMSLEICAYKTYVELMKCSSHKSNYRTVLHV